MSLSRRGLRRAAPPPAGLRRSGGGSVPGRGRRVRAPRLPADSLGHDRRRSRLRDRRAVAAVLDRRPGQAATSRESRGHRRIRVHRIACRRPAPRRRARGRRHRHPAAAPARRRPTATPTSPTWPGWSGRRAGCDALFHLAAVSNVNDAHADPVGTVEINVAGTARACEAARRNQLGRVLLASTVWVYAVGGRATGPSPRTRRCASTGTGHVYTASKIAAELVVSSFGELYGLPVHDPALRHPVRAAHARGARDPPLRARAPVTGERSPSRATASSSATTSTSRTSPTRTCWRSARPAANQVFNLEGPAPVEHPRRRRDWPARS